MHRLPRTPSGKQSGRTDRALLTPTENGQLQELAVRYEADVILVENTRRLSLPVRYTNARFTIYQAR